MNKMYIALALSSLIPFGMSCRSSKNLPENAGNSAESVAPTVMQGETVPATGRPSSYLPKAIIYKTNGNYDNNVAVNLDPSGTRLVSFPAPSDISENSAPVKVADGYLLDRRGISYNTAFLDITYPEYRKLKHAPSPTELMKMIIPGARVTEIRRLPMTPSEAAANVAKVDSIIKSGVKGN